MNVSSDLTGRYLPFTLNGPTGVLDHVTDTPLAQLHHSLTTRAEPIEEGQREQSPRNTETFKHHVSSWPKFTSSHDDHVQQLPVPAQIPLSAIDDHKINDSDDELDDASPLPMDDNTGEESCCNDSTLASIAEEGRLPWMRTSVDMEEAVVPCWSEEAHPDISDLVRATVEVECEVKSKVPYDRRDRFTFQRFLDDKRMSRVPKPTLNIHKEDSNQMLINSNDKEKVQKRVRFDLSKNQVKTVSRYLIGRKQRLLRPVNSNDSSPVLHGNAFQFNGYGASVKEMKGVVLPSLHMPSNTPSTSTHSKSCLSSQKSKVLAKRKKQRNVRDVTDATVERNADVDKSGPANKHGLVHAKHKDLKKRVKKVNLDSGTQYDSDGKATGVRDNRGIGREERKEGSFAEKRVSKSKSHRRLRWTESMTSLPVNKKSEKFNSKEKTEQQSCQSINETSETTISEQCNGQKLSSRSFHSYNELIHGVHKNDNLADNRNEKTRRRNRSVKLSAHVQKPVNSGRDAPSQSSKVSSATNQNDDLGMESCLAIFGLIVCFMLTFALLPLI
ncbi:uncharacterized protein [Apostichopus japonicus]|uniref:uncharacterized protein n=1 Tax=Stichopus japonicus TaxID=307972 RepID=UPI003AB627BB